MNPIVAEKGRFSVIYVIDKTSIPIDVMRDVWNAMRGFFFLNPRMICGIRA